MGTTVKRVTSALEKRGLRHHFSTIDRNPACPGEVVLWCGMGHPVYSVRQAVELAQEKDRIEIEKIEQMRQEERERLEADEE